MAQLLPASSRPSGWLSFFSKKEKMSLASNEEEVVVTVLAYQAFVTQVQEIMCLDRKILRFSFL